jgi:hypothetical protein
MAAIAEIETEAVGSKMSFGEDVVQIETVVLVVITMATTTRASLGSVESTHHDQLVRTNKGNRLRSVILSPFPARPDVH